MIFIVEDDPDISELIEIIVQGEGYKVKTFLKLDTVLSSVRTHMPDLILMDLFLHGTDSKLLIKKLKSDKKTSLIPIILVSAGNSLERIAEELHVDGCLPKPFNITDLTSLIKKLIAN